nr:hypothetical protein K-LCC10_0315 [Kaumoebavirus]
MNLPSSYFKSSIAAAITLIMMLAWNDLIQSTIKTYLTPGENVLAKLVYASAITLAGGIILTHLKGTDDPTKN